LGRRTARVERSGGYGAGAIPHMTDRRHILVAPDSFKGTLSAAEVAHAVGAGVEAAGLPAVCCPIGDGGEGTMDAILAARGGRTLTATVADPLGRPVDARFAVLRGGTVAVVETAAASGLMLVAESERDAWGATTRGTGELIVAAVRAGAQHVVVAVGGSATTDGGEGAVTAMRAAGVRPRLSVVCDVATPWEAAPSVFGPQKGADAATVTRLEARLDQLASRAPRDPRGVPMTGGAGGLSGGLWAWYDAELVPGAAYVLDVVGFDELLAGAALVITGEGALDDQTFAGKAVGEVARRAAEHRVPCQAVVGVSRLSAERAAALGLEAVTEAGTTALLRAAGAGIAERLVRV
jgi:glycerate 2-kinase